MLGMRTRPLPSTEFASTQLSRILIVGDPVLTRGLLRAVLARVGYSVAAAINGAESLGMFVHSTFSLVMIAVRLPDMSGLTLARRIRGLEGTMTPRILLFGDAWDQTNLSRLAESCDYQGYLAKPISVGRLVATVRELTCPPPLALPAEEQAIPMQQPVDMAHLNDFTGGDEQLEKELATIFIVTAEQYIKQLRGALDQADNWRRTAHALKGASGNIGAKGLYALAKQAELSPPSAHLMSEISSSFETVRDFFLGRRAAAGGAC